MDVLYVLGWVVGVVAYVHLMLLAFESKMARLLHVPPEGLEIDYRVERLRKAPPAALPASSETRGS